MVVDFYLLICRWWDQHRYILKTYVHGKSQSSVISWRNFIMKYLSCGGLWLQWPIITPVLGSSILDVSCLLMSVDLVSFLLAFSLLLVLFYSSKQFIDDPDTFNTGMQSLFWIYWCCINWNYSIHSIHTLFQFTIEEVKNVIFSGRLKEDRKCILRLSNRAHGLWPIISSC